MKTIFIASGKGGVGKSTVAAGVAVGLALMGHEVGLLDADIYGPSIPHLLGVGGERLIMDSNRRFKPLEFGTLKVISVAFMVDLGKALIWRGPMLSKLLRQMFADTDWGALDYMIIDLPPGTGDVQLTLAQKIANVSAVIVTTPQRLALADVTRAMDMLNKVRVEMIGVIENMSSYQVEGKSMPLFVDDGNCGTKSVVEELALPLLAKIPFDTQIAQLADAGKFLSNYDEIAPYYSGLNEFVVKQYPPSAK